MTPRDLLLLMQWFDSQFPVGAYAHSGGLEAYAQRGAGQLQLRQLAEVFLGFGGLRLDLAACALAWRAAPDAAALEGLGAELSAWRPVPGSRESSLKLGRRWLRVVRRLYPSLEVPRLQHPHHAVVVGCCARLFGVPEAPLLLAYGHSALTALLYAATRCMSVSPEQVQEILRDLHGRLVALVEEITEDPPRHLWSCTPAWDVRAHEQALLHTRLFQS
ncbi:MAG: urease accessory UreF family protein [Armatimonadota bacterium]|nr:urease accessory UreF family protein [Armatimonadota bacterium]MDR7568614.1 urease accessory UreF family protein [Armatimonadota bacterium]